MINKVKEQIEFSILKIILGGLGLTLLGGVMFYLVFTTGNAPNVLVENPIIYNLTLGVALFSGGSCLTNYFYTTFKRRRMELNELKDKRTDGN